MIIFPYYFSHNYRYCTAITIKGNDYVFARPAENYMYDTEMSSSLHAVLISENHHSFHNLKRNNAQSKSTCISLCIRQFYFILTAICLAFSIILASKR